MVAVSAEARGRRCRGRRPEPADALLGLQTREHRALDGLQHGAQPLIDGGEGVFGPLAQLSHAAEHRFQFQRLALERLHGRLLILDLGRDLAGLLGERLEAGLRALDPGDGQLELGSQNVHVLAILDLPVQQLADRGVEMAEVLAELGAELVVEVADDGFERGHELARTQFAQLSGEVPEGGQLRAVLLFQSLDQTRVHPHELFAELAGGGELGVGELDLKLEQGGRVAGVECRGGVCACLGALWSVALEHLGQAQSGRKQDADDTGDEGEFQPFEQQRDAVFDPAGVEVEQSDGDAEKGAQDAERGQERRGRLLEGRRASDQGGGQGQ